MLISREELRFDFQGAVFRMESERDRELLAWIFSQFLYGEVTGIQCGHWLYHAPHLNAAAFLAKQASEELSHVKKFLRIFSLMGAQPSPAHWAVRFLSTGMMGKSWGEHVALEMALGEGLVLGVFYAMAETIPDPEIRKILDSSSLEEERHVEFGERETKAWLEAHPGHRKVLLALALIQAWALHRLKGFCVGFFFRKSEAAEHPVLGKLDSFFGHSIRCFEARIERLGLSDRPISGIGFLEKMALILALPLRRLWLRRKISQPLLTATYLRDPAVEAEVQRFRES